MRPGTAAMAHFPLAWRSVPMGWERQSVGLLTHGYLPLIDGFERLLYLGWNEFEKALVYYVSTC